jgi:hypothetical protein
MATTRSGPGGEFEVRVPPGSYVVAGNLEPDPGFSRPGAEHVYVTEGQAAKVTLRLYIDHP